jgi:hypothetical protein
VDVREDGRRGLYRVNGRALKPIHDWVSDDERLCDGRTKLTILVQAANTVSRDAIIASGMEDGLQDALDLLEEAAPSLERA